MKRILSVIISVMLVMFSVPLQSFGLGDTLVIENFESFSLGSSSVLTLSSTNSSVLSQSIEQKTTTPSWNSKAAKITVTSTTDNGWISAKYTIPSGKKDFTGYEGIIFKITGQKNISNPNIGITFYDSTNRPFSLKESGVEFYLRQAQSNTFYKSSCAWSGIALPLAFDGEILIAFDQFRLPAWYGNDNVTPMSLDNMKSVEFGFSSTSMSGQSFYWDDITLYKKTGDYSVPTLVSLKCPEVAYIPERLPDYLQIAGKVLNSSGIELSNQISWSVTPSSDKVSIASDGTITINPMATAGNYTVTATVNGTTVTSQTVISLQNRQGKISTTFNKTENRNFPSLHYAWNGIDDGSVVKGSATDMAKHDLMWNTTSFYQMFWNKTGTGYEGLSTSFTASSLIAASNKIQAVKTINTKTLFFACVDWIERDITYLPDNHEWWLRDARGNKIKGWGEGTYQAYLLDTNNSSYIDMVAAKAKATYDTGLFDGLFIDCWRDDPSYVSLVSKIRTLIGPDALIIVNSNMFTCPNTAPYINGIFMESYKATTSADWTLITNTLNWAEKNLRMPRVNCLETWAQTARQNTNDIKKMRATTTLSLTQSNGYCLFADDNSLSMGDHLHDYYDFWVKRMGRALTGGLSKPLEGYFYKEFEKGTAVYNPIGNNAVTISFNEMRTSVATGIRAFSHTVLPYDGDLFLRDAANCIVLEDYFSISSDMFKEYSSIENFDGTRTNYGNYTTLNSALNLTKDGTYGAYSNTKDAFATQNSLKVTVNKNQNSANLQELYIDNPYFGQTLPGTQPQKLEIFVDSSLLSNSINIKILLLTSDNTKYVLPSAPNSFTAVYQGTPSSSGVAINGGNNGIFLAKNGEYNKGFIKINLSDFKNESNSDLLADVTTVSKILFSVNLSEINNGEYFYLDSLSFIGKNTLTAPPLPETSITTVNLSSKSLGGINFTNDTVFAKEGAGAAIITGSIIDVSGERAFQISKTASDWSTITSKVSSNDYCGYETLEFYVDCTGISSWFSMAPYIYVSDGMRYDLPGYGGFSNFSYQSMSDGSTTWTNQTGSYNCIGNGIQGFKGKIRIPVSVFVQSYYYVSPKPTADTVGYATLKADLNISNITKVGFGNGATGSYIIKNIKLFKSNALYGEYYATKPPKVYGATNGESIRRSLKDISISFNVGAATLDGAIISNGYCVENKTKSHTLSVTDSSTGKSTTINFSVIISGDVDGNGDITVADLANIKSHLLKYSLLNGIYEKAANVNGDNYISISDLISVKKHILGIYDMHDA